MPKPPALRLVAGLLLAGLGAGCAGGGDVNTDSRDEAAGVPPASADGTFAVLRALAGIEGNLVLSPYSIRTALALAWEGAGGETRRELEALFGYEKTPVPRPESHPPDLVLDVANRLWSDLAFTVREDYRDRLRHRYGADLERVDFRTDPAGVRARINAWVKEQTAERIPDLLPPGAVDPRTRLALTNAVAFRGLWKHAFDPERTRDLPFRRPGREPVLVATMTQVETVDYGSGPWGEIVELPYRRGSWVMTLVLPSGETDPTGLLAGIDALRLEEWTSTLRSTKILLDLPRFTARTRIDLPSTLQSLGVRSAFDPQRADFRGIASAGDLYLQAAIHEAWIEVDEKGTEAAAATGITLGVTSAPPVVRFDRPFLILVRDRSSGVILFAGKIEDPSG